MELKESYKPVEFAVITFAAVDVIVTSNNKDENELQSEII